MMKQNFDIQRLVRPNIQALKPYSSARDEFQGVPADMVFLDANENPFENGVNRYPDPQQRQLKGLLASIKGISSHNMLLGNGSDEVLDLIVRAFCEPNQDNVIILPPTYGMYEVLANLNAVATVKVNLDDTFQPKVQEVLDAANAHSKILFLCSPNNPTANSFQASKIEALITGFQGLVVIDEAYIDFSQEASWLSRLDAFPNLIVTQTVSKAYAMAGIRLGICYASQEIIAVLNTIKPPYNINALTQKKALELLSIKDLAAHQIDVILKERGTLMAALKNITFVSKIYPSDANFILAKVDDAQTRYQQLIQSGIVIRNRTTQVGCENCLRFTVGNAEENKKLINTLKSL